MEPERSYWKSSWGADFGALEDVGPDLGGILTTFVRNTGTQSLRIERVALLDAQGNPDTTVLFQTWPLEVQPGEEAFVMWQSMRETFGENQTVTLRVFDNAGDSITVNQLLRTPKIRLGNVIPNADNTILYVYLRNDADQAFDFVSLQINDDTLTPSNPRLSVVGGGTSLAAGQVQILKVSYPTPLAQLTPLHIRLRTRNAATQAPELTCAAIRLVNAAFEIGTWHSSGLNPENEAGRKSLRKLHISSMHGPGNWPNISQGFADYFIRTVRIPGFGDPFDSSSVANQVRNHAQNPAVHFWSTGDEPDLHGKDVGQQLIQNYTFWQNDPNTPSYVNLAVQKKFARYGWYTDVVAMDHYAAPNAPNIIPLTWVPFVGRVGQLREALEYTEYLKFNTEPRRMESWVQLATSGTWGQNPVPGAVNYQFWAHVAGGAKGLHHFVAQSNTERNFPAQYQEAERCTWELAQIKTLCLYGEYAGAVTTNSATVTGRALVSEDAMLLFVLNDNVTFAVQDAFNQRYSTTIRPSEYTLEFDIPSWIPTANAWQITPEGRRRITLEHLGGRRYRISPTEAVNERSHIYMIAGNDTDAPETLVGLQIVDAQDSSFTLSWPEPRDNFGVWGYVIRYNGVTVDTSFAPIYDVPNDSPFDCGNGLWEVLPFDAAGNLGAPAAITRAPRGNTGPAPAIDQQPADQTVPQGTPATFSVGTRHATIYQWQGSQDAGNTWVDLLPNGPYGTSTTGPSLLVLDTDTARNGMQFRVVVMGPCGPSVTSEPATLTVTPAPSSLPGLLPANAISLYPNPATDRLTIRIQLPQAEPLRLGLLDMQGRELRTETLPSQSRHQHQLWVEGLPAGLYVLRIQTPTLVGQQKVLVR